MARLKNLLRRARLELEDGPVVEVEQIGHGRFTVAFRSVKDPRVVYLQVDSDNDASKELLARIEGKHIPKLRRLDELAGKDLYKTQYYEPLTAKSKEAWAQFKRLAELWNKTWKETMPGYGQRRDFRRTVEWFKGMLEDEEGLPDELKQNLRELCDWVGSYGRDGYSLEFAKRNLAVDEAGTLILLDPVYDPAVIEAARKKHADGYRLIAR